MEKEQLPVTSQSEDYEEGEALQNGECVRKVLAAAHDNVERKLDTVQISRSKMFPDYQAISSLYPPEERRKQFLDLQEKYFTDTVQGAFEEMKKLHDIAEPAVENARKGLKKLQACLAAMPQYIGTRAVGVGAARPWTCGAVIALVLGVLAVMALSSIEVVAFSGILQEYFPGFGGSDPAVVVKRGLVSLLALGCNIALKYAVTRQVETHPILVRRVTLASQIFCATGLVLFFSTIVRAGAYADQVYSFDTDGVNLTMLHILSMASLFLGSFSAVFILSEFPLSIISQRTPTKVENPERKKLAREISKISSSHAKSESELARGENIIKSVETKRAWFLSAVEVEFGKCMGAYPLTADEKRKQERQGGAIELLSSRPHKLELGALIQGTSMQ